MDSRIYIALGFVVGAGFGGIGTWYFMKTKYDKLLEDEINDVKRSYQKRLDNRDNEKADPAPEAVVHHGEKSKPDLAAYAQAIKENQYVNYADYVKKEESHDDYVDPYIIEPSEYGDDSEYDTVSLGFTLDGTLIDDKDHEVRIEDTIGNNNLLSHFGEFEDDSIYVRNPNTKIDYEVLLDNRYYSDFMEDGPSPVTIEE